MLRPSQPRQALRKGYHELGWIIRGRAPRAPFLAVVCSVVAASGPPDALAALVLTLPMLPAASQRVLAAGPRLRLENRDGAPYSDWLVMSRFQNPEDGTRKCFAPAPADCFIQPNVVHDVARTLRLHNDGDQSLTISALEVNGQFVLVVPPALPASVAPGQYRDVLVRFVAQEQGPRKAQRGGGIYGGRLSIESDDPSAPLETVQLAGFWQSHSEISPGASGRPTEPTVQELMLTFGFSFALQSPWKTLSNQGLVEAVGDEVVSPYWRRADTTKPVVARQLAAFHGQRTNYTGQNELIYWHVKGSGTASTIIQHDGRESQSVLPHIQGWADRSCRPVHAHGGAGTFWVSRQHQYLERSYQEPARALLQRGHVSAPTKGRSSYALVAGARPGGQPDCGYLLDDHGLLQQRSRCDCKL